MRTDLSVSAIHRGGMRVDVQVRDNVLEMDYPAAGGGLPTPLEVLMASLAACAANTLNLVLSAKMGVQISGLNVDVKAQRRAEHPTILTNIEILYRLGIGAVDREIVDRAVNTAEEHLCPVLALLRPGTTITSNWTLE